MTETLSMRHRCAGQSVIENLVRHQADAPPRSWWARMVGRSPLSADAMPWYRAAQGEIAMGEILAQLPGDWTVLHALPAGMGALDIDHLIVGPCGVFTVNTKHHNDQDVWVAQSTLLVDGQTHGYIPAAEAEAQRVAAIVEEWMPLPAPVQPVIAFVDPRQVTIRQKPSQVKVLDAWKIRSWLTNLSPVLSPAEQSQIASLLDNPTTWHETGPVPILSENASSPRQPQTPAGLRAAFELLDAEVREAEKRQSFWKVVGYGLIVVIPVMLIPVLGSILG